MRDKTPLTPFAFAILAGSMLAGYAMASHAQPPPADFSGAWSVRWCDRSNPKLDCGGFNHFVSAPIISLTTGILFLLRRILEKDVSGTGKSRNNDTLIKARSCNILVIVLLMPDQPSGDEARD